MKQTVCTSRSRLRSVFVGLVVLVMGVAMTLAVTGTVNAQNLEPVQSDEPENLEGDGIQLPGGIKLPQPGDGQGSLVDAIVSVVNILLGFLGVALVIWLLYGGVRYAFAGGSEDATGEAKSIILNAIIGIIIIALVYVLANFLLSLLNDGGALFT